MNTATDAAEYAAKRARLEALRQQGEAQSAPYLPTGPAVKLGPVSAFFVAGRTYFKGVFLLFFLIGIPVVMFGLDKNRKVSDIAFTVMIYFPMLPAFLRWLNLVRGK